MKPIEANLLDRAIAWVAPGLAAKRLRGRLQYSMLTGGYTGGRLDRRATREWHASAGSADADLLPDLHVLRERSRDLARNTPVAAGALGAAVTNIVGTGLVPRPRVDREALGLTDEAADRWERDALRVWNAWADSDECAADRTGTFADLQDTALRAALESGDVFVIKRWMPGARRRFGYALQLIEADRVDNPNFQRDGVVLESGRTLAGGVERDRDGAPVAYWIRDSHPGGLDFGKGTQSWTRMPAFAPSGRRVVLHIYRRLRPDQARGAPYLAAVIESLKQIGRYTESELMATVVASLFTVFVKTDAGEGLAPMGPTGETGAKSSDDDVKLASGAVVDLAKGESIEIADPSRPNANFDPFFMAVMRQIAAALEQPVSVILKSFTASYSASRGELLEAWKFYKARRAWLARALCRPAYADVIEEAVRRGRLAAAGFLDDPLIRDAWLQCLWIGPTPGQLDPKKEADAAVVLIDSGISTVEEQTAAITGGDWEINHRQSVKEAHARAADLPKPAAPATENPDSGEEPKETDPEDPASDDETAKEKAA